MPAVTIRNLPIAVHRALKLRAVHNQRSTEAEIRVILEEAVSPREHIRVGSELLALGRRFGGVELDLARVQQPTEPADFQ